MQDIDFDELDRAVSSTIGPKPKPETPSDDSVAVRTTRPENSSPQAPPAARRSSGRFMDVVHPSSDMRSPSAERSEPRHVETPPASREAEPEAHASDWPDPIDFHGFNLDESALPKEPAVESESEDDASPKPLESPFLSDTKVEKRPLGAFSTADQPKEAVVSTEEEPEIPLLEAPDEPLLTAEAEKEEAPVEPEPEAASKPEPEVETEPEPAPAEVEEPVGPTSITQQYKEQPSTADQPSGAIFDTEAYHQPLAHPEKKRSGAMIILWIVVLILLGAGVGAGVYFFVLPIL